MTAPTLTHHRDAVLPIIELRVVETLDVSQLMRLSEQLEDAITLRPERLVVDLTCCDFVDAQAIRVLMDAHRAIWKRGGRLVLRGVNAATLRLLAIAGVRDVFTLEPVNNLAGVAAA